MSAEATPVVALQPYDREKRVLLTRAQEERLGEFLRRLEHATGGLRITSSELTRGLLVLVFRVEEEILKIAAATCDRATKHPATADRGGKDQLEGELAAIVFDAVMIARHRGANSRHSDIAGITAAPVGLRRDGSMSRPNEADL